MIKEFIDSLRGYSPELQDAAIQKAIAAERVPPVSAGMRAGMRAADAGYERALERKRTAEELRRWPKPLVTAEVARQKLADAEAWRGRAIAAVSATQRDLEAASEAYSCAEAAVVEKSAALEDARARRALALENAARAGDANAVIEPSEQALLILERHIEGLAVERERTAELVTQARDEVTAARDGVSDAEFSIAKAHVLVAAPEIRAPLDEIIRALQVLKGHDPTHREVDAIRSAIIDAVGELLSE